MVHSALKRRAFADDFKDLSMSQPSQGHDIDILKPPPSTTALSSTSNITIHHAGHTSRAPIPVLLEMMTPQEFATVLRARVDRLISQWPLYASQPFPHGLPSPSSSGSPLVQSGGKGIEMSIIHSFVSFFYPEEHHIHHNGDISPDTLFVHLSGLQTLLSFLSSKELRVVVRNRLTTCSAERSSSVQAIVDVMRNMSIDEGDGDDLDLPWKQSWQKNLSASDLSNPVQTKSYVDVGTSTEPSSTLALLARPSSSDEFRPPKRPKYASSYPLFQEVVDDMIMKSTSNQNTMPSYHHHPDAISSSVHKMTDPILRPVSNASFKKSPAASQVINIEDDGEADAEGDTDTDIEMDDSVDERHDSKTLTIAQVINSFRPEEHASTNHTSHSQISFSNSSLNKPIPASTLGPPSESSSGGLTNSAVPKGRTTVIMPNRVGDIPKGPPTMRGLVMPNESTYTVSSSGSRTPPIPVSSARQKDLSLSRTDTSSLQVKQELLSDWETTVISTSKGDGTSGSPIEVSEQMSRVGSVVKELPHHKSSSIISSSSSTISQTRKFEFGASCQGVRSVVKEPESIQHRPGSTAFPESTHQQKRKLGASIQDTSNPTSDGGCQSPYDGHDLPPYDEIMNSNPTSMSSKPITSASDTTSASTSKQHRSKLATRDKKSSLLSKSISRSRSRSVDEKRHRLPRKPSAIYSPQAVRLSTSVSTNTKQLDKRAWDGSSRSSSCSTSRSGRSRSASRPRVPYRPRNYSYSRPPSPSSAKDRHWSPEPTRRRERGRSRSRRRRGDDASSKSTTTRLPNAIMDHWSPGRDRRDDGVYFESTRMDIATPMRSMGVSRSRAGKFPRDGYKALADSLLGAPQDDRKCICIGLVFA